MTNNIRLPVFDRPGGPALPGALVSSAADLGGGLMQIGDLAHQSGKTVRAIHLYEELQLLTPVSRSKGGYRLYDETALTRIRWIVKLQELGMSLPDIQSIARDWADQQFASRATERIKEVYSAKLADTRAQLERLTSLESELKASLAYLATCGDLCEPDRPTHTCNRCDLHHESACAGEKRPVPELVAGFRAQQSANSLSAAPSARKSR